METSVNLCVKTNVKHVVLLYCNGACWLKKKEAVSELTSDSQWRPDAAGSQWPKVAAMRRCETVDSP
jgi:hypothetical protein